MSTHTHAPPFLQQLQPEVNCRSQARRPHALSAFVDRVHLSLIRCAGCFGQRFCFFIIRPAQAAQCQRPLAANLFERSAARGIAAAAAFCLIFAAGCADSLVRSNIPLGSHEFADKLTPCSAVRRGARWSTANAVVAVQMG